MAAPAHKVVLLRHGESEWNVANKFTGWTDVDLTSKGTTEANAAGQLLKAEGFEFDCAFTSLLKRAIRTLWITLDNMDLMWIPVTRSWRLNERHYGDLQGLDKAETAKKFGDEQVLIWRRSYDTPPPPLEESDERFPGKDRRYTGMDPADVPKSESLKDTVARFLPIWHDTIAPTIKSGKRVIIAAHGNSLRALVKYLDDMSEEAILKLNIPTGVPLVYELDADLKPIRHYYLGDQDAIAAKAAAVAAQGKAK
eukprot:PRCOL_00002625-RA